MPPVPPKTTESKAPVPVIAPLGQRLEKHREAHCAPQAGFILVPRRKGADHASVNLNSLLKWQIKPKFKQEGVRWHGWHAFRRGLSTTLHRLGVPDKDIQQILRHQDVQVTQKSYIKTATSDAVTAMRLLENLVTLPEITDEGRRQ
jgi:integrase